MGIFVGCIVVLAVRGITVWYMWYFCRMFDIAVECVILLEEVFSCFMARGIDVECGLLQYGVTDCGRV